MKMIILVASAIMAINLNGSDPRPDESMGSHHIRIFYWMIQTLHKKPVSTIGNPGSPDGRKRLEEIRSQIMKMQSEIAKDTKPDKLPAYSNMEIAEINRMTADLVERIDTELRKK